MKNTNQYIENAQIIEAKVSELVLKAKELASEVEALTIDNHYDNDAKLMAENKAAQYKREAEYWKREAHKNLERYEQLLKSKIIDINSPSGPIIKTIR